MKKCLLLLLLVLLPLWGRGQVITTFAGNGAAGNTGDGGMATAAKINYPIGGVFDKNGNYYFALGTIGNCIRKITPSGIISTVAGTGSSSFSGDGGQATLAELSNPQAVTVDTIGDLFIADAGNHRIRKVDITTGIISTIAGTGTAAYGGDGGPATAAKMNNLLDLCFDKLGNLFFSDAGNSRIRKIIPAGIVSTVVGTGTPGLGADGIAATASAISTIEGIFVDDSNNLFIGDGGRIRRVTLSGIINTIAGNTSAGSSGDGGPATAAQLSAVKIAHDVVGNIYIAERGYNKVRKIDATGIINTIVGTGTAGYSGDGGMADTAEISYPAGVTVDHCGNVYLADAHNFRIRKITYPSTPTISITTPIASALGSTVTVTASIAGGCCASYSYLWMNKGIVFATTSTPSTTYTKTNGVDSITVKAVGCGDTTVSSVHVVVVDKTGTSPSPSKGGVTCYPNPAHTELVVDAEVAMRSVSVVNLLGQVVYFSGCNGVFERVVDVRELPVGVYFVRVVLEDGGVGVERFVKIN